MKRFIFDMDGTLTNSDYSSENTYFKSVFGNDSKKLLDGINVYLDSYEKAYSRYDVDKLCRYLNAVTGLKFTPEIIEGWMKLSGDCPTMIEDGVVELLEYLKSKGHSLVVLTNWFREAQTKKLENVGLIKYFDDIYTGDTVLKPHKEAYICAKDRFSEKDCVVIGNDLYKDYVVPRDLGFDTILYDKIDLQRQTVVKVKRMNEIIERF